MHDREDEGQSEMKSVDIPIHIGPDVKEPEWANVGIQDVSDGLGANTGADYNSLDAKACKMIVWKVLHEGYNLSSIPKQMISPTTTKENGPELTHYDDSEDAGQAYESEARANLARNQMRVILRKLDEARSEKQTSNAWIAQHMFQIPKMF